MSFNLHQNQFIYSPVEFLTSGSYFPSNLIWFMLLFASFETPFPNAAPADPPTVPPIAAPIPRPKTAPTEAPTAAPTMPADIAKLSKFKKEAFFNTYPDYWVWLIVSSATYSTWIKASPYI